MINSLEDFIAKVNNFDILSASEKCDFFAYFLTEFKGAESIKPKDIEDCFVELKIPKYSNVSQYLRLNSKRNRNKTQKFIKDKNGYHIERQTKREIRENINIHKPFIETNKTLRDLLPHINTDSEKVFLKEAISAFEVTAFRASVIMVWLLTLDHLFEYILSSKLAEFNAELAKVTDKRVKVSVINSKDDFSDIPENKFIEICRAARIISNDVRKILDEKLGIRNSAAHPSNIILIPSKAFSFIEDLVSNVILKY